MNRVRVEEMPPRTVAVRTFTWSIAEENVIANRDILIEQLNHDDEWNVVLRDDGTPTYHLAAYNSPLTLPMCRTNEIHMLIAPKKQ